MTSEKGSGGSLEGLLAKAQDPVIDSIIIAYHLARQARLHEGLVKLLGSGSSSLVAFQELFGNWEAREANPIQHILRAVVYLEESLAQAQLSNESSDTAVANTLERILGMYKSDLLPVANFYVKMAGIIKAIADERELPVEDVARSKEYTDAAMRRVFPTRKEAWEYQNTVNRSVRENWMLLLNLMVSAASEPNHLPTFDQTKVLFDSLETCYSAEFDRVYGGRA